jgi:hypothetical protein
MSIGEVPTIRPAVLQSITAVTANDAATGATYRTSVTNLRARHLHQARPRSQLWSGTDERAVGLQIVGGGG